MRIRTIGILLLIALMCGTEGPQALAEEAPRQSLQEKRAIRQTLGMYRRARRDLDAKAAAVVQAGSIGPAAVEEVLKLVDQDLKPLMDRYRQDFLKAARAAAAQKYQSANMEEVAQLQQQVLALRDDPELTKEQIKQVGDPAMLKLEQLLILAPEAVVSQNRALAEHREKMRGIGLLWQKCQEYLAQQGPNPQRQDGNIPGQAEADPSPSGATFEERLRQEELQVLRMAMPLTETARQVLDHNAKLEAQLDFEEARCVTALNTTRILLGLEPLRVDLKLVEAARGHSADMAEHNFFSHESPIEGKRSFTDRARLAGTTSSGENIAMGRRQGHETNLQWFHSPGHHRNMLANHARVGIGRSGKHWTELFGR